MLKETSLRNVFRFVQLRPSTLLTDDDKIEIDSSTDLAKEIKSKDRKRRKEAVDLWLSRIEKGREIWKKIDSLRHIAEFAEFALADGKLSVDEFRKKLAAQPELNDHDVVVSTAAELSDLLLATKYASANRIGGNPRGLSMLYKALELFLQESIIGDAESLVRLLRRPVSLGALSPQAEDDNKAEDGKDVTADHAAPPTLADIERAIKELVAADTPESLVVPPSGDEKTSDEELLKAVGIPFSLKPATVLALNKSTMRVLENYNINPAVHPIDSIVSSLEDQITTLAYSAQPMSVMRPKDKEDDLPPASMNASVRSSGIADLLVVKQNIKAYEATEIAHVENVMAGETRKRSHRFYSRREEVLFSESERTTEQEHELETTDRFELNRETEKTLKKDTKLGFDLSISGKYGPTVEFTSNLSIEASQSSQESSKSATQFAQEVVERSVSKVIDRVKESRTLTLIRESEENNEHNFVNDSDPPQHIVGIYQFLEKIYEAQVFNYGIRQMFDFMIPEPASYLWDLESQPADTSSLPKPPLPLSIFAQRWQDIDAGNYKALEIRYGAENIPPPPSQYILKSTSVNQGQGTADEEGQPRSFHHVELDIPAGYQPVRATLSVQALTDEDPVISVQIGHAKMNLNFPGWSRYTLRGNFKNCQRTVHMSSAMVERASEEDDKLGIDIFAYETANYAIELSIRMSRSNRVYYNWQKAAFRELSDAYANKLKEYKLDLEEAEARVRADAMEQDFGDSPSTHLKQIMTELKKHCISIITGQWYDNVSPMTATSPPQFNLGSASAIGSYIRFFEQAFEWDQLQYVFYPYYWAHKDRWKKRFLRSDVDFVFQEFLQSGSARVVVPVRPGFEIAVNHYLETGNIWSGEGSPPDIGSETYVSIVDEIKSRTGASQGETPEGDHWDVRLPTSLVLLKANRDLPEWTREAAETWVWHAEE
jgi:hypothetical protein